MPYSAVKDAKQGCARQDDGTDRVDERFHAPVDQGFGGQVEIAQGDDGGDFYRHTEVFRRLLEAPGAGHANRFARGDNHANDLNVGIPQLHNSHRFRIGQMILRSPHVIRLDAGRIGDAGKIGRANETEHDRRRVFHVPRGVYGDLRHLRRDDQHGVHAAIKRVFNHEVGCRRIRAGVAPEHIHVFAGEVLAPHPTPRVLLR